VVNAVDGDEATEAMEAVKIGTSITWMERPKGPTRLDKEINTDISKFKLLFNDDSSTA
jgi:hypothetical protein